MLGVGTAFVQEHLDRVLRTRKQLEEALGIDCLGVLPHVGEAQDAPGLLSTVYAFWFVEDRTSPSRKTLAERQLILVKDDDPFSAMAEALRAVKVAIDINQIHNKTNVVGIVSALPSEGKTTVSANLAEIIGKVGRKTLLIDGDLRNPTLTRALVQGPQPGLIEAMAGIQKIRRLRVQEEHAKFDFLVAPCRHDWCIRRNFEFAWHEKPD